MVYYEPCVTQTDKDHIAHRLSKYIMDIRHDHELYRHLHCYWPDDPIGPNNCSFDVITAPGSITIYGDWMRAFTLRRYGDQDMLLDFCDTKELAIGYWAEKLDMNEHAKNSAIMAIDTDAFFEDVEESLTQWLIEEGFSPDEVDPLMNGIREDVSFDESNHPFAQLLDLSIDHPSELPDPNPEDASNIFDSAYIPGEHYTLEWVRTCMALQWAAQTYMAAQSYKKQKQTRRYLATQRHMTLCEHPPLVKPPVVGI
nr:MAG TPA: hypothetical protein [Caudoviricetes sp.]